MNFLIRLLIRFCKKVRQMLHRMFVSNIKIFACLSHGKKCYFGHRVYVNNYDLLEIGDKVSIGDNAYLLNSKAKIIIGNDVMLGPNVTIVTGDHRVDIKDRPMCDISDKEKLPQNDQDVVFEGDNWVGANAVILKGVTVGKGAVVAAGALVITNVNPYEIWGGVPAKCIKKRFNS